MEDFYLYGAGINGRNAIKFFRGENIAGIIDSDAEKWGAYIDGIQIISLEEYVKRKDDKFIYISAFDRGIEIAKKLDSLGIVSYDICPWFGSYFASCQEIIDELGLKNYSQIIFIKKNPITGHIAELLRDEVQTILMQYKDEPNGSLDFNNCCYLRLDNNDEGVIPDLYKNKNIKLVNAVDASLELQRNMRGNILKKFQGIHRGKRCFIIGNGPSLAMSDLNILKKNQEICFGVNRIYLAYDQTDWRPDYYIAADAQIIESSAEEIKKMTDAIKFIRHSTNYNLECDAYEYNNLRQDINSIKFAKDITKGIYNGFTVVYEAIQIAAYMGFDEIYLLGVDMTVGINGMRAESEGAHFYRSPDVNEKLTVGDPMDCRKCLAYAEKVLEEEGIKLFNATRNAYWDELQKVDFDELFS